MGFAAISLLALLLVTASAATATAKVQKKTRFDAALSEIVKAEGGPPGVLATIRKPGRTTIHAHGTSNLANGRPMGIDQHMRLASMAKAYNGAVVLALVDRGKLELDDTVGEWLPGLWPNADQVTVEQLLAHTSGLPEYIEQPAFIDLLMSHPTTFLTPVELIGFVNDLDVEFTPGTEYSYSDSDNIMAGLIAEAAADKGYNGLLRQLIYKPLGLTSTSLPKTPKMPRPYIRGYDGTDDVSEYLNPALAWASGGLVSTQREVGRFFRAYVGGKLFGKRARKAHRNFIPGSSSPPGPGTNSAGAGLFRYETRCGTVYGHTGSFPGYRQFAASSKNGKRSVVFTVNDQIVPGMGSPEVNEMIRSAQAQAVCRALR